MTKAYGINTEKVYIAYQLWKQYEEVENVQEAGKYEKIYFERLEERKRDNYKNKQKAINSININSDTIYDRVNIISQLKLLLECPKESKAYMEWSDGLMILEEKGLLDFESRMVIMELGYYVTGEEFLHVDAAWIFEEEWQEAIKQAKRVAQNNTYKEREKLIILVCEMFES